MHANASMSFANKCDDTLADGEQVLWCDVALEVIGRMSSLQILNFHLCRSAIGAADVHIVVLNLSKSRRPCALAQLSERRERAVYPAISDDIAIDDDHARPSRL